MYQKFRYLLIPRCEIASLVPAAWLEVPCAAGAEVDGRSTPSAGTAAASANKSTSSAFAGGSNLAPIATVGASDSSSLGKGSASVL